MRQRFRAPRGNLWKPSTPPIRSQPTLRVLSLPQSDYSQVSKLQSILFNLHLLHKSSQNTQTPIRQPPPFLITTSFHPIYTFGRREASRTPPEAVKQLLSENKASVAYTPRGGQVTFHGPGQIVAYPIIDLKQHGLSPRCYIRALENAVIRVLEQFAIRAFTTEEAGVWVRDDRKVASIGVNLRRWVSSHGLALNVDTDLEWFKKIVACGLEGVEMWSMKREWEELEGGDPVTGEGVLVRGSREMAAKENLSAVDGKVFKRKIVKAVVAEIMREIGCRDSSPITVEEVEELGREYGLSGEDGVEFYKFWRDKGLYVREKGGIPEVDDENLVPEELKETVEGSGVPDNSDSDTDPDEAPRTL
ncbi:hypothetical protein TWF481_002305 [Arthrobotrys musiformis]|uniref:lipoyl(octanoyl) transferase n=1 Tax=Arthrobotrys musiformis TaxID=47236 RepID=A0AAV9VSU6_9PEZI